MKYKITIGSLTIFLTAVLFSCNDNPSGPVDNTQPGKRDYTWTVDTLFLPFSFFTDIKGSAPNDLWACGPNSIDKSIYHYDGQNWKADLKSKPIPFSPLSISSIGPNKVWSSGQQGIIWKFNGSQWSQVYKHNLNGIDDITFQSIRAVSSNKIFAAGYSLTEPNYRGIIIQYDGNNWSELNIPQIRTTFADIEASENGKVYFWGVTNEQFTESRYQFCELEGNNLKEIYNGSQNTHAEYGSLLQLGERTYFIIGYDFFSYNGLGFTKIGRLSEDPKFLNVGWGRNVKDIFLGMRDGIAHYNGKNTIYLYQSPENIFIRKGIVFDTEVFFIGRDSNGNTLMIHGKLD